MSPLNPASFALKELAFNTAFDALALAAATATGVAPAETALFCVTAAATSSVALYVLHRIDPSDPGSPERRLKSGGLKALKSTAIGTGAGVIVVFAKNQFPALANLIQQHGTACLTPKQRLIVIAGTGTLLTVFHAVHSAHAMNHANSRR